MLFICSNNERGNNHMKRDDLFTTLLKRTSEEYVELIEADPCVCSEWCYDVYTLKKKFFLEVIAMLPRINLKDEEISSLLEIKGNGILDFFWGCCCDTEFKYDVENVVRHGVDAFF